MAVGWHRTLTLGAKILVILDQKTSATLALDRLILALCDELGFNLVRHIFLVVFTQSVIN